MLKTLIEQIHPGVGYKTALFLCAFTYILFFGLFSNIQNITEMSFPSFPLLSGADNPYRIVVPDVDGKKVHNTLVLSSLPDESKRFYPFVRRKVDSLKDILESRWGVIVEEQNLYSYDRESLGNFESILVVDERGGPVPQNLLDDLRFVQSTGGVEVAWVGLNTEKVASALTNTQSTRTRHRIKGVEYKEVYFETNARILADYSDTVANADAESVRVLAAAETRTGATLPIAIDINESFVLIAHDIPDAYSIRNHAYVFIDVLHHTFGTFDSDERLALVRLEDINGYTYLNSAILWRVYDVLRSHDAAFHLALIPRYVNPEQGIDWQMDEGRRYQHIISAMLGEGNATLVQHGYTHQYDTSVSGIGYEFWDENKNAPLAVDSIEYTDERIMRARTAVEQMSLPVPDIWETPHYALSDLADARIDELYPLRYEHKKHIGSLTFPVRFNDTVYIPENLGYLSDAPANDQENTVADFPEHMNKLEVLEEPVVASFFWHPWRDTSELEELLALFEERGYTFVSAYDLLETNGGEGYVAHVAYANKYQNPIGYQLTNALIAVVLAFFALGVVIFISNIVRIHRYLKEVSAFDMPLDVLLAMARKRGRELPKVGILVPARNEADVIENTVRRLSTLDYPKTHYRVVVIVDERELLENKDGALTTRDVVARVGAELNAEAGTDYITFVEVPEWYSGIYGSTEHTYERSTKGRALNWALQVLAGREELESTELISILDADGRLHTDMLKEVAHKRIVDNAVLLQGPVFQISNFDHVTLVGIAAGLELAIHHLTSLPSRLKDEKKVQFLAGTNYIVDTKLIHEAGGWDQHALVEDAELALRIYEAHRVTAGWIGSPEIEQTPPRYAVYKRQRERWVRGHLQLLSKIHRADIPQKAKWWFYWKILSSQFRFIVDIGLPVVSLALLLMGMLVDLGSWFAVLSLVLLVAAFFMWNLYGYMFWRLRNYIRQTNSKKYTLLYPKLFFFNPFLVVIQSIPRMEALYNWLKKADVAWYKTERTVEQVTKQA